MEKETQIRLLNDILSGVKEIASETGVAIGKFFSDNKGAILKQFGISALVFAAFKFLGVEFMWASIIALTGLLGYWLLLFKSYIMKKAGMKSSETQVILYTLIAIFGLYNPFHLDLVHLGIWFYGLERFGSEALFTTNISVFFLMLLFFWGYSARYMAETSYQSLGKWKSILVASAFVIVIGTIVYNVIVSQGVASIALWFKPIILAIQVALAYVIYASFGFAKRHFKRATIVSSDSVEGDTINTNSVDDNTAGSDADEFITNEAVEEAGGEDEALENR
jgi:hypothetical protein